MADHIQIGDISPRIQFTGDGAQTLFTFPFPIFKDADLKVYEDTAAKTLTTDYTVWGAGNSAGGSVTFLVAPANGVIVTLKRQLAIQRTSDFQESGEFRSKVINDELDSLTASLQQVGDDVSRSLRLGATDTAASLELPAKGARTGKFLAFDANGDPVASDGPAGGVLVSSFGATLIDDADGAAARTTLGLVIGTDVLSPNGDGSGLTGIATGASNAEKTNIILNAFRIAVNGGLSVQNMVDGVNDELEDETGIDVATSTNETHNAVGAYYTNNVGGFTADQIPTMTSNTAPSGTASANSETYGGAWKAIDDSSGTVWNPGTATGWLAYDFAIGKTIARYSVQGNNDNTEPKDWTFEGWNGSSWVVLDTRTTQNTAGAVVNYDITSPASYSKYRLNITANNGHASQLAVKELEMLEANTPLNMTLVSNATTALAQPTDAFIVLWQEDVDAITLNTDLTAEVSRDGGTTWTTVTLTEEATLTTGRILTGTADISAQPAGASMKYRIKTLNTKGQRIHGVGLQWS